LKTEEIRKIVEKRLIPERQLIYARIQFQAPKFETTMLSDFVV
jgi:hypothetical protein